MQPAAIVETYLDGSTFHSRGQPYSLFTWAWIALTFTSSASFPTRFHARGSARWLPVTS